MAATYDGVVRNWSYFLFNIFVDSVVNHVSSESGIDLGLNNNNNKDGELPLASPSGTSPFSESLSLLAGQSAGNGGGSSSGPLPFACEQCGLSFAQREELEKHEITHPSPNQVRDLLIFLSLSLLFIITHLSSSPSGRHSESVREINKNNFLDNFSSVLLNMLEGTEAVLLDKRESRQDVIRNAGEKLIITLWGEKGNDDDDDGDEGSGKKIM